MKNNIDDLDDMHHSIRFLYLPYLAVCNEIFFRVMHAQFHCLVLDILYVKPVITIEPHERRL